MATCDGLDQDRYKISIPVVAVLLIFIVGMVIIFSLASRDYKNNFGFRTVLNCSSCKENEFCVKGQDIISMNYCYRNTVFMTVNSSEVFKNESRN
jgi:hypothetical protein